MNMKKFVISLATTCFLGVSLAFAQVHIPYDQFQLGGLHIGNAKSYVHSIYGTPTTTSTKYTNTRYGNTRITYTETYGNSVDVDYTGIVGRFPITDSSGVFSVTVTANNGWATYHGATVGMKEKELRTTYGDPTDVFKRNGITYYQYVGYHCLAYYVFGIKNGKVVSIMMTGDE